MDTSVGGNPQAPAFPDELRKKVAQFQANLPYYTSQTYKEHSIRKFGINPVLQALGWDVENAASKVTDHEVMEEDSIVADGAVKAPDYGFMVAGRRVFFLEAKKPAVKVDTSKSAALQIRRYCWTASLPLGIVTDFEEWSIYDCRATPKHGDPADAARIRYFRYDELEENWAWLWSTFGKECVEGGSIDRYATQVKEPKGTKRIDESFLAEISSWRASLARDIAGNNPSLTASELNSAVQTLIDRIVFLRIAEARGIEEGKSLLNACEAEEAYTELLTLFKRADDRYNSGLFHFNTSNKQQGSPVDTVSEKLVVTNRALSDVVKRLYYPYPFEFSVLPADILGRVYEQFLGDTITLQEGSAQVEQKPEVRKSGGVYYTPSPVVQYLVEETLGPILQGLTPQKAARLRIVDPACGSGSFLIVAFQYLIDWHLDYYSNRPRLSKLYLEEGSTGPRLRTEERKRILLNNIYGVDIDPQAVEVTKLSLLLKVIEGQTQLQLAARILPDLHSNIRCGNSLISTDFPVPLDPADESYTQVRPFSWTDEFPSVFRGGGKFDAVIGNPPYLNIDSVWGRKDPRLQYIKNNYPDIYADKTDLLFYFLGKSVAICDGEIGFIVSRSFLEADKARKLRRWLSQTVRFREILDFRDAKVFKASINTAIIRVTRSTAVKSTKVRRFERPDLPAVYSSATLRSGSDFSRTDVPVDRFGADSWSFGDASAEGLCAKIDRAGIPVGQILHVGQGMQTGANKAFEVSDVAAATAVLNAKAGYRRVRGRDISRVHIRPAGPVVIYPEAVDKISALPPVARSHLQAQQKVLKERAAFKRGDCEWWRFTWPLHNAFFSRAKIVSPYRATRNTFAVDPQPSFLALTDTTVLYDCDQEEPLDYIVAILNSNVLTYRYLFMGKRVGGSYEYFENTIAKLPIPRRGASDPQLKSVVKLARDIGDAVGEAASTKVPQEVKEARSRAAKLERQLDQIIYDLFGLDEDDQRVIEKALGIHSSTSE